MEKIIMVLLGATIALGCARVSVQAPKDPIKVDISMRLDIYQHIKNDIDDIENMVTGSPEKSIPKGSESFLNIFVSDAYAAEGLSEEVETAALRRKDRRDRLVSLQKQGILGENKTGLVEIRLPEKVDAVIAGFVSAENADRIIIYQSIAKKNGSSLEDVKKLYAQRLQADAALGIPIEIFNDAKRAYEWVLKK